MSLTEAEIARYARQLLLPGFSAAAQERLRDATVHVVGAGEVAGPALHYLATAGVGALLLEDPYDVAPGDGAAWLYPASEVGQARLFAAASALRAANASTRLRSFTIGAPRSAVLLCASSLGAALEGAERARQAGLLHVVAVTGGDGGEVVVVPNGAPCFSCGSRPGSGGARGPGASAALGALAAMELLLQLSGAVSGGRRVDLAGGVPQAHPTSRVPGCACGRAS